MSTRLVMYRGDDRTFALVFTSGGTPLDLDGALEMTFSAKVAATPLDDEEVVIELTMTDGDIVPAADQGTDPGEFTLTIPHAATVDLTPGTYLADVQLTTSLGDILTWPEAEAGSSNLIRLILRADISE